MTISRVSLHFPQRLSFVSDGNITSYAVTVFIVYSFMPVHLLSITVLVDKVCVHFNIEIIPYFTSATRAELNTNCIRRFTCIEMQGANRSSSLTSN